MEMKYYASFTRNDQETSYYLGSFRSWNVALKHALEEQKQLGELCKLEQRK